jgi:hypothetical protein
MLSENRHGFQCRDSGEMIHGHSRESWMCRKKGGGLELSCCKIPTPTRSSETACVATIPPYCRPAMMPCNVYTACPHSHRTRSLDMCWNCSDHASKVPTSSFSSAISSMPTQTAAPHIRLSVPLPFTFRLSLRPEIPPSTEHRVADRAMDKLRVS